MGVPHAAKVVEGVSFVEEKDFGAYNGEWGILQGGEEVWVDDGVVVEEKDRVGALGESVADADIVATGKAEVLVGFKDGNVGKGGADGSDGIVA